MPLFGSGSQRRTSPFLWFPELSSASPTTFSQQQLAMTEPQQSSNWLQKRESASLSWCQTPIWGPRQNCCYRQTVAGLLMWGALSDERLGLSFTIAAGPRQHSHSRVRVQWDSWWYFSDSDLRLPQPWGTCPYIYISQEQSGPVISTGTGFPFHRLLRLAGLRWRYSNPPPTGVPTGPA
jgi:hypothetical protein